MTDDELRQMAREHCADNGQYMSPVAPQGFCNQYNVPPPVNEVPEPSSLALVLLAFGALILFRRRAK